MCSTDTRLRRRLQNKTCLMSTRFGDIFLKSSWGIDRIVSTEPPHSFLQSMSNKCSVHTRNTRNSRELVAVDVCYIHHIKQLCYHCVQFHRVILFKLCLHVTRECVTRCVRVCARGRKLSLAFLFRVRPKMISRRTSDGTHLFIARWLCQPSARPSTIAVCPCHSSVIAETTYQGTYFFPLACH
jgi:hypothetical protein